MFVESVRTGIITRLDRLPGNWLKFCRPGQVVSRRSLMPGHSDGDRSVVVTASNFARIIR
jgi:hypothetical protein